MCRRRNRCQQQPTISVEINRPIGAEWGIKLRNCCKSRASVKKVRPGSIAELAGLVRGDRILAVDGVPIRNLSAKVKPTIDSKTKAVLTVRPPYQCRHSKAKIADANGQISLDLRRCKESCSWGFSVSWNDQVKGLIVTKVRCRGYCAGVRKGDRIVNVNDKPVNVDSISAAGQLQSMTGKTLRISVERRTQWAQPKTSASSVEKGSSESYGPGEKTALIPPLYSKDQKETA